MGYSTTCIALPSLVAQLYACPGRLFNTQRMVWNVQLKHAYRTILARFFPSLSCRAMPKQHVTARLNPVHADGPQLWGESLLLGCLEHLGDLFDQIIRAKWFLDETLHLAEQIVVHATVCETGAYHDWHLGVHLS